MVKTMFPGIIRFNTFLAATFLCANGLANPPMPTLESLPDAENIQKAQCREREKEAVRALLVKLIRDANDSKTGYKPADQFNKPSPLTDDASIDAQARAQASKMADALFAAINNPENPADAASEIMSGGDPKRRTSFRMDVRCKRATTTKQFGDNDSALLTPLTCGSAGFGAVGFEVGQVLQTRKPAKDVVDTFARASFMSESVKKCDLNREECRDPANYSAIPADFKLQVNKEYFVQDTTEILPGKSPMVNRNVFTIHPRRICGARAFVITGFGNGGSRGFDRSTLLGFVVKVGGKTLVIGNFAGQSQAVANGPIPTDQDPWPIWFPLDYKKTATTILTDKVAQLIEAEEDQPLVLGRVGGPERRGSLAVHYRSEGQSSAQ